MRVCILGPTGSGKGTQAQLLGHHLQVPVISTGEILRQAIERTQPILEYYQYKQKLLQIDGEPSPEQVHRTICQGLGG